VSEQGSAPEAALNGDASTASVDSEEATADIEVVPPVVIVMVTRDPGWWFDETLESIAAQTYGNWSFLVIDANSSAEVEDAVARIIPGAHMQQLEDNPGFGAAVNEILTTVEGAAFYLLCHDDVKLDPGALQSMVAEAYRSNAGIVGPKLVSWLEPDRLLAVGMGADKTGSPADLVDRGELDQEQYDAVRDVFYIPGSCTLIRADLFTAIGGFDDGIDFHADDLDLAWRAHLAGARVVAAPEARVAHLEGLGLRRRIDDRRRLQLRHRLRVTRVNYRWFSRVRVMPQAAVLAVVEVVYAVVMGRFRHARDVIGAWWWNFRRRGEIRRRRKEVKRIRVVKDRDIRRLQVRGSARVAAYFRSQRAADQDRLATMAAAERAAPTVQSGKAQTAVLAWAIVAAVWVIGTRQLITGGVPEVGQFTRFPASSISLVQEWFSGYRDAGLGSTAPAPTSFGFLGGLGFLLFGQMSFLRNLLIIALLPAGGIGVWRLCRPIGSRRAKVVGLVMYAAIPVAYNSFAQARWSGLVLYAAAPWMLAHLAHASRLAPFGAKGGEAGPGVPDRPLLQHIVMLGFVTALAGLLVPFATAVVLGMAVALIVGGLLVGQFAGALRILVTAIGGVVVAAVLHLPWSLDFVHADWEQFVGVSSLAQTPLDLGAILRFNTGPYGTSNLAYAVLVAASLALLVGKGWRLSWAGRMWVLALGGFALVWVASEGWLPFALPGAEVLLAPVAVALSFATAMGMAAFEVDLPDYHFGWRQLASVVAAAAVLLAAVPVLGSMLDGSWNLPDGDFSAALSSIDGESAATPMRVLWMGDTDVLPLAGWSVTDEKVREPRPGNELAYGTSDRAIPTVQDLYPGSPDGATSQLTAALQSAIDGGTSRLGALLAPMGIEYVIVPDRNAPSPFVNDPQAPSPRLLSVLDAQLDLTPVTDNTSVRVYRNVAFGPARAQLPAGTQIPSTTPSPAVLPAVTKAPVALGTTDGFTSYSGSADHASTVYLASAGDGWTLQVNGQPVDRRDALGWASSFAAPAGSASMSFSTPIGRPLALAGETMLWLIGVVYLLRTRVVRDERRRLGNGSGAAADQATGDHDRDGRPGAARAPDPVIDISAEEDAQPALHSPGIGRSWPRRPEDPPFASVDDVTIGAAQRGRRGGADS
jgi:GT2 family glycosyltransferase